MAITTRNKHAVIDWIWDLASLGKRLGSTSNDEESEMDLSVEGTSRSTPTTESTTTTTVFDDEPSAIVYPIDEIDTLQQRFDRLVPLPRASLDRPPVACGIIRRIQLLGIFPTTRWLSDPTMHPDVKELFGGTPFFALGEYRVAYIDLLDSSGTIHSLIGIVNKGVEGMSTGYWGAFFERNHHHHHHPQYKCWARLEPSGENETSVKTEDGSFLVGMKFHEFTCIDICEDYFGDGTVSWICTTQLERILALAAEFLLALEWTDRLPMELIECLDRSSRLERRRRADAIRQQQENTVTTEISDENVAPQSGEGQESKSEKLLGDTGIRLVSRSHEPLNTLPGSAPSVVWGPESLGKASARETSKQP